MHKRFCLIVGIIAILSSCNGFDKRTKTFVKSVKLPNDIRIDWYVYGSMSGPGLDYLQISNDEKEPFFTSFYLSDIRFQNDSLYLSLWKGAYELDKSRLEGINLSVDTLGKIWNRADHRIDRLRKRNVDIKQPHFVDVFCEKSGCE